MKTKLILLVAILCIAFSACGSGSGNELTYTPDGTTEQAERMFENNSAADLVNLSRVMAGNNDYKDEQNNYFNYLLAKITDIDTNNINDKYSLCLEVMDVCLDEPLTQAHVISGFKQLYFNIDTKLTEETKQYMLGEWLRIDRTSYAGMRVEVLEDEEFGFCSKITAIPEDTSGGFRIGDIKWNDVQFANHNKFYMQDLVVEENGAETYYKNTSKTTNKVKGSTATINFDKDTISIRYDSAGGVSIGSSQLWVKVGSASEAAYKAGTFYEKPVENKQQEDGQTEDTGDDTSDDGSTGSIMDEYSLASGNVADTTRTASSEQ